MQQSSYHSNAQTIVPETTSVNQREEAGCDECLSAPATMFDSKLIVFLCDDCDEKLHPSGTEVQQ